MKAETGLDRINEAHRWCLRHETERKFYTVVRPRGGGGVRAAWLEQMHHGVTVFALAAWRQLRQKMRGAVTEARGEPAYYVPDGDGRRTIEEPALVIVTPDEVLYLTGCSWGYSGEGPHGAAAVLHDLELFPTFEAAMKFVASQPSMTAAWSILRSRAPFEVVAGGEE